MVTVIDVGDETSSGGVLVAESATDMVTLVLLEFSMNVPSEPPRRCDMEEVVDEDGAPS